MPLTEKISLILKKIHEEVDSIKHGLGSTRSERKKLVDHLEGLLYSLENELANSK